MKRLIVICICVLLLLPTFACRTQSPVSSVDFICDTVVTITAYAPQETVDEAAELCRAYERIFSKTIEGSDIWNLNHANGAPVKVNPETAALLELAIEIGAASDGAFDITIAPVSGLWDFTSENPKLPDQKALQQAVSLIDFRNIEINDDSITLKNGAQLDLGGIAKGYIADCTAAFLKSRGVEHACINIGGNIVVFGGKPDGKPWTIGIRDPNGAPDQSEEVIELYDGVLVTSGNYERFFLLDGKRYHHILDPKDGMPVQNGLASVTILLDRSAVADALSTACFVLGEDASKAVLNQYRAQAIFLYQNGTRSAFPEE